MFAADHVYRMDVRQMARFHADRDADVTVAAIAVPIEKASALGVMSVSADDAIVEFQEKPAAPHPIPGKPQLAYASMGNYLFKPASIRALLERAIDNGGTDFGRDVLPPLAGSPHRLFAYDFACNEIPGVCDYEEAAYWRDVGALEALAEARRDVTGRRPRFNLRNPAGPIRRDLDLPAVGGSIVPQGDEAFHFQGELR